MLLGAGLVILLYFPHFSVASLQRDDLDWVALTAEHNLSDSLTTPLWGIIWRPTVALHFLLAHHWFNLSPSTLLGINLTLHCLVYGLIFFAVSRTFNQQIALVSALIFVTRPSLSDAVLWNSAAGVLYASASGVGAILLYAQYLRRQQVIWYALAFLMAVISILSKEEAVIIPVVMILLVIWRAPQLPSIGDILPILPLLGIALAINLYRLELVDMGTFHNPGTASDQFIRFARGVIRSVAPLDSWLPPLASSPVLVRIGAIALSMSPFFLSLRQGLFGATPTVSSHKTSILLGITLSLAVLSVTASGHEVAWRYAYVPMLAGAFAHAAMFRTLQLSNHPRLVFVTAAFIVACNIAQYALFAWP